LIKILKKPTDSVRFQFYKPETEKTRKKPSQTGKKLSQNQAKPKNRAKPEKPSQTGFCPKKRTETSRFEPVSVLFFKKFGLVTCF
jgi:hypothetical protein